MFFFITQPDGHRTAREIPFGVFLANSHAHVKRSVRRGFPGLVRTRRSQNQGFAREHADAVPSGYRFGLEEAIGPADLRHVFFSVGIHLGRTILFQRFHHLLHQFLFLSDGFPVLHDSFHLLQFLSQFRNNPGIPFLQFGFHLVEFVQSAVGKHLCFHVFRLIRNVSVLVHGVRVFLVNHFHLGDEGGEVGFERRDFPFLIVVRAGLVFVSAVAGGGFAVGSRRGIGRLLTAGGKQNDGRKHKNEQNDE